MVEKKEVLTEVTSIAKEEERTGEKIEIPKAEELKSRAVASFIKNRTDFSNVFNNLSAKAKNRVVASILDLPQEGLPVLLKTDEERRAFSFGQRVQTDRFIILSFYVNEQYKINEAKKKETANVQSP